MSGSDRIGRRVVLGGMAVTGGAILVAVTLVSFDAGPSTTAGLIRGVHRQLLVVAIPIILLVEGVLIYAVWRFRDNDDRKPTPEYQHLELGWTVATGLVILFVGTASYQVMVSPQITAAVDGPADGDTVEVQVTGKQWYWSVGYPAENKSIEQASRIVLPADRPIRIRITSADVVHSFHAPALGLKQDAVPGVEHSLRTRITEQGEYRLYCAEYCGTGHAEMSATIQVVSQDEYRKWIASKDTESTTDRSTGAGGAGSPSGDL